MNGPVICNQVDARLTARLAAHPSRPRVIELLSPERPWDIDPDTQILVTRLFWSWGGAPAADPGMPRLDWIQTFSTGVEGYPEWLLRERKVSCGRGLTSVQIAEYAMAAILHREKDLDARRLGCAADWNQRPMGRLAGRRLGLLGYGSIGQAIARRALAFDMEVHALRRGPWPQDTGGVIPCGSAAELFALADHLVLATPLTAETAGLVDAALLSKAKPGLHLINISRGGIVDQEALIAALDSGQISFATLDVTTPEPLPEGHPLFARPDVLITPHVSYAGGGDGMESFAARMLANLDAWLEGRPLADQVDMTRGY